MFQRGACPPVSPLHLTDGRRGRKRTRGAGGGEVRPALPGSRRTANGDGGQIGERRGEVREARTQTRGTFMLIINGRVER